MSNPIVDNIVSSLESGLIDAGKQAGVELQPQVLDNLKSFFGVAAPAIERWVLGTISGTLTKDDLKLLLEDILYDAIIHALTILEKAEIEVDKTKNILLQLVGGIVASAVSKSITI